MAHKKGQGSSRNGRTSNAQFRGIKVYAGQDIRAGGSHRGEGPGKQAGHGGQPAPAVTHGQAASSAFSSE